MRCTGRWVVVRRSVRASLVDLLTIAAARRRPTVLKFIIPPPFVVNGPTAAIDQLPRTCVLDMEVVDTVVPADTSDGGGGSQPTRQPRWVLRWFRLRGGGASSGWVPPPARLHSQGRRRLSPALVPDPPAGAWLSGFRSGDDTPLRSSSRPGCDQRRISEFSSAVCGQALQCHRTLHHHAGMGPAGERGAWEDSRCEF